ncbi:hypothetical protein LguiA_002027 [Lonicera macranthoides]
MANRKFYSKLVMRPLPQGTETNHDDSRRIVKIIDQKTRRSQVEAEKPGRFPVLTKPNDKVQEDREFRILGKLKRTNQTGPKVIDPTRGQFLLMDYVIFGSCATNDQH